MKTPIPGKLLFAYDLSNHTRPVLVAVHPDGLQWRFVNLEGPMFVVSSDEGFQRNPPWGAWFVYRSFVVHELYVGFATISVCMRRMMWARKRKFYEAQECDGHP